MQVNFLNRYLYFPYTWLHNIYSNLKLNVICGLLYFISYIHLQYILIFFILSVIVFLSLDLPRKYLFNMLKILAIILTPYTITMLIKQAVNNKDYSQSIHIYAPYFIKLFTIYHKRHNIFITKYIIQIIFQCCYLPKFIFKGILLTVLNVLLLYILFATTLYEDIILYIINFHRSIGLHNKINKKYTIMTACSSQLLEDIINCVYKIFISLKLRNYSIMTFVSLFIYSVNSLIKFIKVYSYNLSTTVYTRLNM
uniref:Uncharacterized protein n=1 Tax=Gelidium gabrielsonii TaxID=2483892 RepID=A0A3G2QX91_9FLOR|nr:hypothetical protein [Gelidium gabrielsonii]AYO27658.1 hypothetical protein [Gelidium gabrielsonii]